MKHEDIMCHQTQEILMTMKIMKKKHTAQTHRCQRFISMITFCSKGLSLLL